jgi:hypothetical protein
MSLNSNPLKVVKVMDPRLQISQEKDYIASKGGVVNSWQQFPSVNTNSSSVQVTLNPPNRDIVVSRLIYKKAVYNWTITGTNTSGGTLLNAGYHAPRAMPMTATTQSESITINDDTITQAPVQQYWRALLRYRNEFANRWGAFSLAPSMLDQFQEYSDGVNTIRNPLAAYGDNSYENTRAGYVGYVVNPQAPGNTTATGTLTTYEPILISPFVFGNKANDYSGLAGVQNMSYTASFKNPLSRILSLVQGQGAPAGQIVLNEPVVSLSSFSIFCNYITPDPVMPVPRNMSSSYYSIVSYPTATSPSIASGASVVITMQSIQVTSIPKRLYIFAKEDDGVETAFSSDTYMALDDGNPITLTWNNSQFLSQATTQDLYSMSVKNGCNMSYSQFKDKTGSVLAVDFSNGDIGLWSNQSAGSLGNYQLSLTCRFKNTSSVALIPTLYVVVVSEGVFNCIDGHCSHMIGVLSPSDVLDAPYVSSGQFKENQDVYGGSFKSFKRLLRKGHDFIKQHKLISRGLSMIPDKRAQVGSKIARELGYGLSGGSLHNEKCNTKYNNLSDLAED